MASPMVSRPPTWRPPAGGAVRARPQSQTDLPRERFRLGPTTTLLVDVDRACHLLATQQGVI